jgi:transposase-like protein
MAAEVRCPFCGAPQDVEIPRSAGAQRVLCQACHRAYLLQVTRTLGLFRSVSTRIL